MNHNANVAKQSQGLYSLSKRNRGFNFSFKLKRLGKKFKGLNCWLLQGKFSHARLTPNLGHCYGALLTTMTQVVFKSMG